MRWFGIATVIASAPALLLAGYHVARWRGGIFCLAFCFLSPNILVQAVEIRSYPLFFTLSAWASLFFSRLVIPSQDRRAGREILDLILLASFLLAAVYTHFYGLVFAACIFGALFTDRLLRGGAVSSLLVVASVAAIFSLGVTPFILAAFNVSDPSATSGAVLEAPLAIGAILRETLGDIIRLAIRTIMHGSHFVYLASAGLTVLGATCLGTLIFTAKNTSRDGAVLLGPLIIAFPLLAGLSLLVSSFDVLAPHYNLWMQPLVAVFLSLAFCLKSPPWRIRAAHVGGVFAIVGHLAASAVFLSNSRYFTHGPGEWVASMITDPSRALVVHDGSGPWAHVYFPVHYLTGGKTTQALIQSGGELVWVTPSGLVSINESEDEFVSRYDIVFNVSVRNRDTLFIGRRIREADSCGGGELTRVVGFAGIGLPVFYCANAAATLLISARAPELP